MNFADYLKSRQIHATRVAGVGGTDDGRGSTLSMWLAPLALGMVEWLVYAASIAPLIRPVDETGRKANLGYTASCYRAAARARSWLLHTAGTKLLFGYSQGAEAAGNAYTRHVNREHDMSDTTLLLIADPRGWPTALKPWLSAGRLRRWTVSHFGVTLNGYRGVIDAGTGHVYSVAILGDPITAMETWRNPLGLVSNLVGFFKIHSRLGVESAAVISELRVLCEYRNGNTRQVVLYATHPFTQLLPFVPEWFAELIAPRTVPGESSATLIRRPKKIRQQLARISRMREHKGAVESLLNAA